MQGGFLSPKCSPDIGAPASQPSALKWQGKSNRQEYMAMSVKSERVPYCGEKCVKCCAGRDCLVRSLSACPSWPSFLSTGCAEGWPTVKKLQLEDSRSPGLCLPVAHASPSRAPPSRGSLQHLLKVQQVRVPSPCTDFLRVPSPLLGVTV